MTGGPRTPGGGGGDGPGDGATPGEGHGPAPRPPRSVVEGEETTGEFATAGRLGRESDAGPAPAAGATPSAAARPWQSDFDALPTGRQGHVRIAGSSEELRGYFDRWTAGAEPQPARGPKIPEVYRLADGTIVQWRLSSRSGGETIDIFTAGERDRKVHLE